MPDNHLTGWRPDLEDQHLEAVKAMEAPLLFGAGDIEIPQNFDTRSWKPVTFQGPRNSCDGHAQAGVRQSLNWLATKGKVVMISRWFCYITAQMMDGGTHGDNGASINGAFLAGNQYGTPTEDVAPYPGDNVQYAHALKFSQEAWDLAKQHPLRTTFRPGGIDDYFRGQAAGLCSHAIGIPWNDTMRACRGLITTMPVASQEGHALEAFGWVWYQGERWPIIHNSHGKQWGAGGKALCRPDVFDRYCNSRLCTVQGGSDLAPFEDGTLPTREVQDWSGMA